LYNQLTLKLLKISFISYFFVGILALYSLWNNTGVNAADHNEDTLNFTPREELVSSDFLAEATLHDNSVIAEISTPTLQDLRPQTSVTNLVSSNNKPEKTAFYVPFYSQFNDISDPNWRKVGCGIASLAMLIEFYKPNQISVDKLLQKGINNNAFLPNAGWIHNGLINLANEYGLQGTTNDISFLDNNSAFTRLEDILEEGPVMASVHYTFDPQNPIPHLVVINGIDGNTVHYNDPAEDFGGGTISREKFLKAWKKRYIEIRPIS